MAKTKLADVNKAMGMDDYKPTITLDKNIYPDLDKLKVDDVVDLSLKVKINSVSKSQYDGGKLHVSGTIENAETEEDEED